MAVSLPNIHPRVIIIGASFAGLKAALTLPRQFAVTVIDKSPWFEFLPNIHELVSGIKTPHMLQFSNAALVRRAGHRYLYDTVTEIRPEKNQVITRQGEHLYYDFCIIAAGSATNTYGVPGADQYALQFKSVAQCHGIGRRLSELSKNPGEFFINIVGAGLEGVEALGEILRRYRKHKGLRVRIIENQARILNDAPADIESVIKKHCRPYEIEFFTGESVKQVSASGITLSSGEALRSDATIWTAGIQPPAFLNSSGFSKTSRQWPSVNECLQHQTHENVFLAGDAAGLPNALPKQAYHAIDMGVSAAQNLIQLHAGRPLAPFRPAAKPTIIAFGDLDTFVIIGKTVVAGAALGALKEAVFQVVMNDFDPSALPGKALHLSSRAWLSGRQIALHFLHSPLALLRLGKIRVLRQSVTKMN